VTITGARSYRGEPSRPIPVWNGVLEHRDRIGEALWEFLWCLDRVTLESNGLGLVFSGAPVKLETIIADLKGDKETVRRHLKKLVDGKYIRARRTPYGQVIEVLNSKKFGIWGKQKPHFAVSPPGEKPTGESEKLTYESEKPQSAVSKEDHVIDHAIEAAAEKGAASADPVWKLLGSPPLGTPAFQEALRYEFTHRNGEPNSEVLERVLQQCQSGKISIPRPIYEAKRRLEESERTPAAVASRMPTVRDIVPRVR
jgi:hypothetical protein